MTRSTLLHACVRQWRAAPERTVLTDAATQRSLTRGQLDTHSARVARTIQRHIKKSSDNNNAVLMLTASPSVAVAAAHVGVLRAGALAVPVNAAWRARELAHACTTAGQLRLAIVDPPELAKHLPASVQAVPLATLGDEENDNHGDGNAPLLDELDEAAAAARPALVMFTSGTTGLCLFLSISSLGISSLYFVLFYYFALFYLLLWSHKISIYLMKQKKAIQKVLFFDMTRCLLVP